MVKKAAMATVKKSSSTKSKSSLPAGGYEAMISTAISTLAERNGSSPVAILKAISNEHKDIPEDRLKLQIKMALKRMTAKEKLVKVKASYKLASAEKAKKQKKERKEAKETKAAITKKKVDVPKVKKSITKKKTTKPTANTKKAGPKKTGTKMATKKTSAKKK